MRNERDVATLISRPFCPKTHSKNFVFNSLLFLLGLSIGVVLTLCFKSFPFTLSSQLESLQTAASSSSSPLPHPYSSSPPTPPPLSAPPTPSPPVSSPPPPVSTPLLLSVDHNQTSSVNDTWNRTIVSSKGHASLMHRISDEELLWRASMVPQLKQLPHEFVPKVAFMFLTPGPMPLAPLWEMFFKGHEALYNIYIHPRPSHKDSWPQNSVFYNRRISSKPVSWGSITMIDAERRLLANALLDFSNQRFVLLSDSCIPLFNFTTVYDHLMNSGRSFLGSFDDPRNPGRGRYNPQMNPEITIQQWRKGAQWFEVHRDIAVSIVSDRKYYDIFRRYCLRPCYNDEHYLPTMVNILHPEKSWNRSVTWVDWSKGGAHPREYGSKDVTDELLYGIRRRSNCNYNGQFNGNCFLFARKFLPDTTQPLLRVAPMVMGFNPSLKH